MTTYIQSSVAGRTAATPGLVVNEQRAVISSDFAVETSAGISPGVVVSRGTDPEKQAVVGGATAAKVFGISCRIADIHGSYTDTTNQALWAVYEPMAILHTGFIWVACTGTGSAGSRTVSYNTTTGAIVLGSPGSGEAALYGVTLWNTVSSGETLALLKCDDIRAEAGYVVSIDLNTSGSPVSGVVDLTVVESVDLNTSGSPSSGAVDLSVVESIDTNTSGTPLVGDVDIQNGTSIGVTKSGQAVTVAYTG
jgi:hypothetical protein